MATRKEHWRIKIFDRRTDCWAWYRIGKHAAKFADRPSATREISNLRGTPLLGDAAAEVVKIPAGADADKYLGNIEDSL